MSKKDLGFKSVPRNPLLFSLLYRMSLVEQIGSGIQRIRDVCRDYGVAEQVTEQVARLLSLLGDHTYSTH